MALLLSLTACGSPWRRAADAPVPDPPAGPVQVRAPLVDIQHYDVDVDIDHRAGFVRGQVAVRFAALPDRPATALELDAVELRIAGVWDAAGTELEHARRGDVLVVQLAEPLPPGAVGEVTIHYSCFPRRGVYFVGPSAANPTRPWHLWTQGETHEARFWIPCWDLPNDRATSTLHATVDEQFLTVAAGELTHSRVNERTGRRTDTWKQDVPCVSYLFTLVAGDLRRADLPGGTLPLPVIADADSLPDALQNFRSTPDYLAFFAEFTGQPYPYPKYAQSCVHDFTAGGQENVSATTLFTETIHDPADEPQVGTLSLISHEGAHQWFGDYLTCADWSHLWLNESFATWCEALYDGHARGPDAERLAILEMRRKALNATDEHERPIVWKDYPDPDAMFGVNSYEGGAIRLHLLGEILGRDALQQGVAHYVRQHAAGVVVTEDLRRSLEESSGADLRRFFDEWLYGAGFPKFRVRLSATSQASGLFRADADLHSLAREVSIEQTQREDGWRAVFHLPVTVAWSRGGVEQRQRLQIDAVTHTLPLPGDGPLDWVCFDATTAVPGAIDLVQSEAMWRSQLRTASEALVRLTAAQWFLGEPTVRAEVPLAWEPAPESVSALLDAVADDELPEVRVAALAALAANGAADDPRIAAALTEALGATDARLREVAAAGLSVHGDSSVLPPLLTALEDPNASVVAAALGALVDRDFPGAFALCVATAAGTGKQALDQAIVRIVTRIEGDERVLPFLLAAARWEPVPRVRAAALAALAGQPDIDGVIFRQLGESLNDASHLVRAAAATGLGQLPGDETRRDAAALLLAARRVIEVDPSVLERLDDALR